MQIQDQIYLIIGITGSFSLIFFVAMLIICGLLCVFKRDICELKRINRERYAYNNPTIQPGEELSVRGYQLHSPLPTPPPPPPPHKLVRNVETQVTHRRTHQDNKSQRSLDFNQYRAAMENEKPRILRGGNAKFQNSTEYLDQIDKIDTESVHEEARTAI